MQATCGITTIVHLLTLSINSIVFEAQQKSLRVKQTAIPKGLYMFTTEIKQG